MLEKQYYDMISPCECATRCPYTDACVGSCYCKEDCQFFYVDLVDSKLNKNYIICGGKHKETR